mmetsp:Transcript_33573/g.79687  ORF Transcript_33573/g.79687 Transcript_33573/m.79687 type:complete len:319 (-) Transcript_33573:183-1139(-)
MYLRSVFVPSAAAAIRPDSKANNFLGNETVSSSISSRQPQFLRSNQHSFQRELGIHSAGKQALPCKLKSLARRSHNRLTSAASSSLDVFVLDIDGVLIDSEPEISSSALKASADLWPGVFEELRFSERKPAVEEGLRKCRPRLIKGFEAMVMARLLLEDDANADAILANWKSLLAETLERWGCDPEELTALFEARRNSDMEADGKAWLAANRPYKGVVSALRACQSPSYFVSSKAGHRVSHVLKHNLGLDVPEDSPRMFAGLLPPEREKARALREIASRPVAQSPGARLHFVDDRFETIKAIKSDPSLSGWSVYLAGW